MQRPRAGGLTLVGVIVVLLALGLAKLASAPTTDATLPANAEVGAVVDDFTVRLFEGGTFTLSSHLADDRRPVIVNFWATWCIPCRAEMPALQAYAESHPELLILGIATESEGSEARDFAASVGALYPLAIDHSGVIVNRFMVGALPTTVLISPQGTVAGTVFGELDSDDLDQLVSLLP